MTRYVALLRAVNVGGHNRISMPDFKALLGRLGHTDVVTYVQSGNAVFTGGNQPSGDVADDIEKALVADLGLDVRCIALSADELRAVIDRNPMPEHAAEPAKLAVTFLSEPIDPASTSGVDHARYAPDEIRYGEREIYSFHPNGLGRSKVNAALWERHTKAAATTRNWNSVTKLLALADG